MDNLPPLTLLGVFLIAVGIVLVVLPLIAKYIPNVEEIPWIFLWVYRRDGFVFATSPILIIVSVISLIAQLIVRMKTG